MIPFRWRLRPLIVVFALAILLPALLAVYWSTTRTLGRRLASVLDRMALDAVLDAFDATFLIVGLVAVVLATLAAAFFGGRLAHPLARLPVQGAARARGERPPETRGSAIVEYQALATSIERLATDASEHTAELRTERDELATLVNVVSEGILHVGADGRIVHANPAASRLLGVPRDAAGALLAGFIRQADLREWLQRALAGNTLGAAEVTLDGRRLLFSARPIAVTEEAARSDRSIVIACIDLTELRRLEGVRRDFVANASHELKTPLTSIRGYAETLLTDDLPPEMKRQFVEVIQSNAERLQGIVDDLLDLSRLESGGWRPEAEDVDVLGIAEEAWASWSERAASRRIEFARAGAPTLARADPGALRQVLSNLYDNALRHTPAGGRIAVRVSRQRAPAAGVGVTNGRAAGAEWVVMEVRDTGSGIPTDALPRIFERFYRVDPARSRVEGGTGLGLAIVKHLVESMGGVVAAESELGKGTTIRVQLPAA